MIQTCLSILQLLFDSYLPMLICCSLVTPVLFITRGGKVMKSGVLQSRFPLHVRNDHSHIVHPFSAYDIPAAGVPMSESKNTGPNCNGVVARARQALQTLLYSSVSELPEQFMSHAAGIDFLPGSTGDMVCFPCPLKEQEAGSALKGLEGAAVAAIIDFIEHGKHGEHGSGRTSIKVHLDRVSCFLMSAYMVTLNDRGKQHPDVKELVRGSFPLVQRKPMLCTFKVGVANPLLRHRFEPSTINSVPSFISKPVQDLR